MTLWGNDILRHCLKNPFEGYHRYIEQGMFQFSASELDLEVDLNLFDQLQYDDQVRLISDEEICIEGYVHTKRRRAYAPDPTQENFTPHGIVTLHTANIILKKPIHPQNINTDTIRHSYPPAQIMKNIGQWNHIIQSADIQPGDFPLSGAKQTKYLIYGYYASEAPTISAEIFYFDWGYYRDRYWKIKINIKVTKFRIDKNIYYLYIRKAGTLVDENAWRNSSNYPPFSSNAWIAVDSTVYSEIAPFYRFNVDQHIDATAPVSILHLWDKDNGNCIAVTAEYYLGMIINMHFFQNYPALLPPNLYYNLASQPFSNILSDLCFLTNSYFTVRNFDHLIVRPQNSGISNLDLRPYQKFIITIDQEVNENDYADYRWRSVSCTGENAFGFDDALADLLNAYYRTQYPALLTTNIKIYRSRGRQIPHLPSIDLGDYLTLGPYDLGIVREITCEKEGRVLHLQCRRLLESMNFNDWVQL